MTHELDFLNDRTKKYEHERNIFYIELSVQVETCKKIKDLNEFPLNYPSLMNFDNDISIILRNKRDVMLG